MDRCIPISRGDFWQYSNLKQHKLVWELHCWGGWYPRGNSSITSVDRDVATNPPEQGFKLLQVIPRSARPWFDFNFSTSKSRILVHDVLVFGMLDSSDRVVVWVAVSSLNILVSCVCANTAYCCNRVQRAFGRCRLHPNNWAQQSLTPWWANKLCNLHDPASSRFPTDDGYLNRYTDSGSDESWFEKLYSQQCGCDKRMRSLTVTDVNIHVFWVVLTNKIFWSKKQDLRLIW